MAELCKTRNATWDEGQYEEESQAKIWHEFT